MTTQNYDQQKTMGTTGFVTLISDNHRKTVEIQTYLSFGRDSANSFSIDDPFVSQRHCRIDKTDSGFVLKDLRSRNGTRLNGSVVREAVLTDNDSIQIGQTRLVFSNQSEPAQLHNKMISRNSAWNSQLELLPNVAASELCVLMTGPSGTGKEVLARWIHQNSPRSKGPFVSVNCSALSEGLVESELFGHVKGSYTGAANDRKGAFQAARGGTLFLDEIGDLPLNLQPKLLRALENEEIRPVGSDITVHTDVRILAATHHDLPLIVARGKFRNDLYHRLNVICVSPPMLKDRLEDFEDLFYVFAKHYRVRFSHAAIQELKTYDWPGNIRELKNVVARASVLFGKQEVTPDLVTRLIERQPIMPSPLQTLAMNMNPGPANKNVIKDLERQMILTTLAANQGNQRKTAEQLGIPKSTLHDRLKTYDLDAQSETAPEL